MANFSYRFSMYNINGEINTQGKVRNMVYTHTLPLSLISPYPSSLLSTEALSQGETVDLDALMADLCSIEQELSTISKPNSTSRGQSKGQQSAPGGRSASTKHTGTSGGGSSGGSPAELY